jgi:flavodoxin short chain
MANILLVYGSTTGNTESVAKTLAKNFQAAGHEAQVLDAAKAEPAGLCQGRDLVVFGCSTWGQDEIVLQDDFQPLFAGFDQIGAAGVRCAVFGCGDEDYTFFCGAVDAITDRLAALGAQVIGGKLKINGDPEQAGAAVDQWGQDLLSAL